MGLIKLLKANNESVVIGFFKRLNRDNAAQAEEELENIRKKHSKGRLIFDFKYLEYISSAGLRTILNCAKKEKEKVKIENTSTEVHEILLDTGFNRMFDIQKTMKHYSIDDLEIIGRGANGDVYRIDRENIVKVFSESTPIEVVERERDVAQEALVEGLPTAISYTLVNVDERYGIVFELIDSDTLSRVIVKNPDDYDRLVDKYINLYKTIHNTKVKEDAFPSIKEVYYDALEECKAYYSEEEMGQLRALLDSVPDTNTLIHGDYHPNNIMVQDDKLILIDMGDMSRGHIVFDFLATASTQVNLVNINPDFAEQHTKMPAELIKKTWRRLIDTYFADKTEEDRKRIEEQICLFAKLKVALAPYFGRGISEELKQSSIEDAKANFIPHIGDLMGAIDW